MKNLNEEILQIKKLFNTRNESFVFEESNELNIEKRREEIENLCIEMMRRYSASYEFSQKFKKDEDLEKEILKFYVSYAQMSKDVFLKINKSANEAANMNIDLLNKKPVIPTKEIDQYTSSEDVDSVLMNLIKLLEKYGIDSIDDTLFNGAKIKIQLPK